MSIKVVINTCYGGFSLSEEATNRVEALTGFEFDSYNHPRHCPVLIKVIEEMGEAANGSFADLSIETIEGNKYIIREYDGTEWVQEPKDVKWIEV